MSKEFLEGERWGGEGYSERELKSGGNCGRRSRRRRRRRRRREDR